MGNGANGMVPVGEGGWRGGVGLDLGVGGGQLFGRGSYLGKGLIQPSAWCVKVSGELEDKVAEMALKNSRCEWHLPMRAHYNSVSLTNYSSNYSYTMVWLHRYVTSVHQPLPWCD